MISPVQKTNVGDVVFSKMMDMIVTGQWAVDSRIPSENELKEQFQVSRNSIRQVIQRLSALGLMESRQGEGTFVRRLDLSFYLNTLIPSVLLEESNTLKLLEFERGLQVESVRLACIHRTPEQLAKLNAYVEQMQLHASDDMLFAENNIDFHVLISDMTRNELYIKSMQILRSLLFYSLRKIAHRYSSDLSISFHRNISDAVERRDVEGAAKLMSTHMDDIIGKMRNIEGARE